MEGQSIDLLGALSVLTEDHRGALLGHTQTARSIVRALGVPLALTSVTMMAGAFIVLLALAPGQRSSSLRWVGGALFLSGVASAAFVMTVSLAASAAVESQLERLPTAFPLSLRDMLDDYAAALLVNLRDRVIPLILAAMLAGAGLLVARPALAWGRAGFGRPRRMLDDFSARIGPVLQGRTSATQRRWALLVSPMVGAGGLPGRHGAGSGHLDEYMRCNGYALLCDRRLDQVVFPGTHNSMAAANLDWVFPNHDRGITAQLRAGYRALLLDAHYWEESRAGIDVIRVQFPPSRQAAFDEFVARTDAPRPGAQLCHGFRGFGSMPLEEGLREVARFLEAHPYEVVFLSMQDTSLRRT